MMKGNRAVKDLDEFIIFCSTIIDDAQTAIDWIAPRSVFVLFVERGIYKSAQAFAERGGSMRGIVCSSDAGTKTIRELVRVGADIRNIPYDPLEFMLIGDNRETISSLHIPERLSIESSIAAFWTSDPTYAEWCLSRFEIEWTQSIG